MMHWIYSAIVGLVVGWIARFVLPGHDSMGILMTMLVGLIGAYVGTAIGHLTGMIQQNAKAGWLWSVLGAVVVLLVIRQL
jgi:uncharacterized membrane protein YeaQ/YmgE (transglycosylase-associated protein family)